MGKILVFQHVPYEILGTFDPMIETGAVVSATSTLDAILKPSPTSQSMTGSSFSAVQ